MQIPLQITFRDMEPSDAVEAKLREKADNLERFAEHITSCRVIVEAPHKHHHKGNIYGVKIDITLPGDEIIVNRHPEQTMLTKTSMLLFEMPLMRHAGS